MVNVLGRVLALVVLGIVLGFPALSFTGDPADAAREAAEAAAEEPTTITSYEAAFDLAEDGDLGVVETITVDFPIAPDRRGIFRFWDRLDTAAPHARREAEDIEVTFDGGPVEVDEFTEQARRFTVAKVGSENEIVEPGEHVYEISYRIPGVIEPGDDDETEARSQFYWQLVPAGWLQDIERSRITVDLPAAAADDVQCVVGLGEGRPCEVQGAGTDRHVVATGASRTTPRSPCSSASTSRPRRRARRCRGRAGGTRCSARARCCSGWSCCSPSPVPSSPLCWPDAPTSATRSSR